MLTDVVLACAPPVAAAPAVIALLAGHISFLSTSQLQRRLYRSLLLVEKLPAATPGFSQIARDVDRQTLDLGYRAQYPQRAREIRDIALIGVGGLVAVVAYYACWWADAAWWYLAALLAMVVVAALWLERAVVNFGRNDATVRELFAHFGAPSDLVRPHTELVARAPALTTATVIERAADIRERDHSRPQTTVAAINAVLAGAHTHGAWRAELRLLTHRVAHADLRRHAATSYDWLLRHLVEPSFELRLAYLADLEHRRTGKAAQRGDVFKVAWLATHYRTERTRLAGQWSYLQGASVGRRAADRQPGR